MCNSQERASFRVVCGEKNLVTSELCAPPVCLSKTMLGRYVGGLSHCKGLVRLFGDFLRSFVQNKLTERDCAHTACLIVCSCFVFKLQCRSLPAAVCIGIFGPDQQTTLSGCVWVCIDESHSQVYGSDSHCQVCERVTSCYCVDGLWEGGCVASCVLYFLSFHLSIAVERSSVSFCNNAVNIFKHIFCEASLTRTHNKYF